MLNIDDMEDLVRDALDHGNAAPPQWSEFPISEIVRRLRLRHLLKQKELARRSGLPPSAICRAEAGCDLRWSTLRKIFAGLNYQPILLPRGASTTLDLNDAHGEAKCEYFFRSLQESRMKLR